MTIPCRQTTRRWTAAPRAGMGVLCLALGGCSSITTVSKEPLPVSVSAANYSRVSGEELYARVNGEANTHPEPQLPAAPNKPLFYAFIPADYSSDVSMETVFRELAVPLAHRGYFNVVYQVQAGLRPNRIDYLLRVHAGERPWRLPTVRTDKVTWGDDDLSPYWHGTSQRSGNLIGPYSHWDDRAGMSPTDISTIADYFQNSQLTNIGMNNVAASEMQTVGVLEVNENAAARDYAIIYVNAFRFHDVMTQKKDAPCVWSMFIAVPLHQGLDFNKVLRTMARSATPYIGETTNGLQIYEVPPGKVEMGEPVEVPGPQASPPASSPSKP
jgi:hypothetical protein